MPQSFDAPTVEIYFEYASHNDTGGWSWALCRQSPVTREHVYTAQELCHTMKTYGTIMSRLIAPGKHTRWRVMARGIESGLARAEWLWAWDDQAARYRPVDTPWLAWPKDPSEIPPRARAAMERLGLMGDESRCKTCKSH
jgi:hypothetical protein